MIMNRENTREKFRQAVLAALDDTGQDVFGELPLCGSHSQGATDADLPELFKAIDAQVDRLCERYDVVLVDYDPDEFARSNPAPR